MVENAGVENTGAKTYGKPFIQKFLTVETRIRMCLIANVYVSVCRTLMPFRTRDT